MPDLTAKRTLVKSPPELWEELSEVERLAKHLGAFGEITITKLEPEHTVAWEGEHASGTVSIEPSGWGTKVTLRAELPEPGSRSRSPSPSQNQSPSRSRSRRARAEPSRRRGQRSPSRLTPASGVRGGSASRLLGLAVPEANGAESPPRAGAGSRPSRAGAGRRSRGRAGRRRAGAGRAAEPEPVVAEPEPEPVVAGAPSLDADVRGRPGARSRARARHPR